MEKIFTTIVLTGICTGAFSQGMIFRNDTNHLVYFGNVHSADSALRASLVTGTATPSGALLRAYLYGFAGTNAGSLALMTSSTPLGGNGTPYLPGEFVFSFGWRFPVDSPSTFQVQVGDSTGKYFGRSDFFTLQPITSTNNIRLLSTWSNGVAFVPRGFGAIRVDAVFSNLSISRSGTNVMVCWPETVAPWKLARSYYLDLGSWSLLTLPLTLTNGQYCTLIPATNDRTFFRLQQ